VPPASPRHHHDYHQQGKARLGAVVHKKTAAALALTAVKNEDQREFSKIADSVKAQFNDGARVNWGGGIMGVKSQHKAKVGGAGVGGWMRASRDSPSLPRDAVGPRPSLLLTPPPSAPAPLLSPRPQAKERILAKELAQRAGV
jgi:hypothetical protein